MDSTADLLVRFSEAHGTSGSEEYVRTLFVREIKKYADAVELSPLGSVIGIKRAQVRPARRGNGVPRVLIEAHMDEIGLVVSSLEENFIRFEQVGYFDPRVLPSQNVIVHGRKPMPGVIGSRPPHVLSAEERKKTIPLRDLFIDVGLPAEHLQEMVSVGDMITLERAVMPLHNNAYAGKAFDDRSGLVALVELLRHLQKVRLEWDVYVVANVNEEDSSLYLGAQTTTFQIEPQIAVCVDVTHAVQPAANHGDMPELGKGVCIARGANVHPFVFEKLRAAAEHEAIPHQITVYGNSTQTNAWMMQVTGAGVPTALVEIPLRYMHTPVELLNLEDVIRTAELLGVFIAGLSSADAQSLQGETFHRNGQTGQVQVQRRAPQAVKRKSAARKPGRIVKQKTARAVARKNKTVRKSQPARSGKRRR